jgi:hypothetical protein
MLGMLAKGARRDEAAILDKGSCGDGGMNTAAAIHKDISDETVVDWRGGDRTVRIQGKSKGGGVCGGRWARKRDRSRQERVPFSKPAASVRSGS